MRKPGLRSALDGKLSSGLDGQVRVPDPAGNAQKGTLCPLAVAPSSVVQEA
jgi:hypothetical protein